MTITIIITAIFVMTLFNLLLNIKECYYTNIPILKIKTKELFNFLLFNSKQSLKPFLNIAPYSTNRYLNNSRFSQLNIFFVQPARNFITNIVADQFTNSSGKIKIDRLNIFGNKLVGQCPLYCFPYQSRFFP